MSAPMSSGAACSAHNEMCVSCSLGDRFVGRGGSEMRLNFSGVGEDDIREGVRRIGKVVSEQVALYGTLTGVKPAEPAAEGRVLPMRRREAS